MARHRERVVRALIGEAVSRYDAPELVAVSCIADCPDTWFAEDVLKRGGRLEVVIQATECRAGLPEWHHDAYDRPMSRAAEVHETGMTESTSEPHRAGSEILVGLAEELLAVWDGKPARGSGGTADLMAHAERPGMPFWVLRPEGADH
ncbi:hypothetical protein [Streptomyces aureus]|uniref:Uncharacterized protein n=1 Tax=Streptomyces aureus TaxID=193461 RepID=A0ABV4SAW5_9ACTN